MARDIEDRLRQSLHARAQDVTPDPGLYARVQSRIRRGRTFRLALAGLATALAVTGIAVAAPAVINRRVELIPGPLATQPVPEPTPTGTSAGGSHDLPPFVYNSTSRLYLMASAQSAPEMLTQANYVTMEPAVRPSSTTTDLEVVYRSASGSSRDGACGRLDYRRTSVDPLEFDTVVDGDVATGCPMDPIFSPDGRDLAWLARDDAGWSIDTTEWANGKLGENNAGFGLPWPADQPVDIQDWVWTELTASTAKGYLVVRTQRDGGWMLLRFPIERQADGALALTLEPLPITAMGGGLTPVAFTSGGGVDESTYVMEIDMAPAGIEGGRIVRRVGAEGAGVLDLPPELFNNTNPPFDVADLWMSAVGDTLVYGNAGHQMAWSADWTEITVAPENIALAGDAEATQILFADLLSPPQLPTEATEPVDLTPVDIFFGMEGADACVASSPVVRKVQGPGVARAALTELLEGPTPKESNSGIVSPFSAVTAGSLNDITIVDGQARVDLADFSSKVGDDSCTKSTIIDALDSTLRQFPTVTSTRYSFDGDVEAFETWLGRSSETGELPPPVADKHAQILAAARTRDYEALKPLMREGFACAFSDQPEPCIPIWKDQERNGEDPLGTLVEILEMEPIRNPDAPIWIWPAEWADRNYLGPRTGIDEGGTWLYYQQGGD